MNCQDEIAPFGFRRRGPFLSLPENKRTTIWVCGAPDCKARAEAWKKKADAENDVRRSEPTPPRPPDPLQLAPTSPPKRNAKKATKPKPKPKQKTPTGQASLF